mmetsp:Transcript_8350/g.20091  ORF Transcript_8350/g.20091 Transcript_8350/m.20091 type:complete len:208 (+) Transcript_8350:147-770(+)
MRAEEVGDAVCALVGPAAPLPAALGRAVHRGVREEVAVDFVPDALQIADEQVAVGDGPGEVAENLRSVALVVVSALVARLVLLLLVCDAEGVELCALASTHLPLLVAHHHSRALAAGYARAVAPAESAHRRSAQVATLPLTRRALYNCGILFGIRCDWGLLGGKGGGGAAIAVTARVVAVTRADVSVADAVGNTGTTCGAGQRRRAI